MYTILLVEDDAALRDGLTELFTREGYSVTTAANAAEARQNFSVYIDLIILDVTLPDGNGVSLCQEWRDQGITTSILFLTAKDEEFDVVRGLDAGGNDYVTKPFRMMELLSRIRALLVLVALFLRQRRRIRKLAEQAEDFLVGNGAPLEFSVQEDSLAPLHNAIAELQNRLLLAKERQAEECRRTSDLTADISHQLKTPLASLRLYCEMDESFHLSQQLTQIERMERLIQSLLRLERLCADGYEFTYDEQEVASIIRSCWAFRHIPGLYCGSHRQCHHPL